jgi:hypothetical protein
MRGQGRAGGEDEEGGRACLGLDPHGRLGGPARRGSICSLARGNVCVTMIETSVEMLRCEYIYDVQDKVSKGSTEFGYRYLPRLATRCRSASYRILVSEHFNGREILFQVACLCHLTCQFGRINLEVVLGRGEVLVTEVLLNLEYI